MPDKGRRTAKEVGSDSPGSRTAKEQRIAGAASGPQEGRQEPQSEKQPPQTSNRRSAEHEHEPTVRKGYEAAEDPEQQGDGDPRPRTLKENPGMQGVGGGRGNTGSTARTESATERAHEGEPQGGHTREGRQKTPGDRDPQQPS
jgi:hypothetical protein